MRRLRLLLALLTLYGCPLPLSTNPTTQSSNCPDKPTGVLTKENLEAIALKDQKIKKSGEITAKQDLGYSFQAPSGYKLAYNVTKGVCIKFYAPDNQPLHSENFSKLPTSGTYTAQVFIPGGSATYDLELSLEDPSKVAILPLPVLPPSPSPTPSPSPPPSCTDRANGVFYQKYPNLRGQEIPEEDYELANEWVIVRNALRGCRNVAPYLKGKWYGEYTNQKEITLTITDQQETQMEGTLFLVDGRTIVIEGEVNPETQEITMREVKVLIESQRSWLLGTNSGELSSDFLEMQGTGKDAKLTYSWSFSRTR